MEKNKETETSFDWELLFTKILDATKKTINKKPKIKPLSEKAKKIREYINKTSFGCKSTQVAGLISILLDEEITIEGKVRNNRFVIDYELIPFILVNTSQYGLCLITALVLGQDQEDNDEEEDDCILIDQELEIFYVYKEDNLREFIEDEQIIRGFIETLKVKEQYFKTIIPNELKYAVDPSLKPVKAKKRVRRKSLK